MNTHLISYSHQITIYQDTQPTLNYNLNYFCLWYSQAPGELTLPKDRYRLWGYSHRIWLQLLEQKYAQNLLRSGLSHDCLIPLDVTILPLLFMVPCVTITGGSYLEYLSCWKKKKEKISEKLTHQRLSLPISNTKGCCFLPHLKTRSKWGLSAPFDSSRGGGDLLIAVRNQVSYNHSGTQFAGR